MNIIQRILFAAFFNRFDATQYSQFRSFRPAPLQDPRLDLTKASREILQGKSRDFERNSSLYYKLANTWEQYTVGTGIQLKSASSDSEWNKIADEEWEKAKPLLNLCSRFGFDNDQGVIARSDFVDGEIFIVLTREGAYARYQLIEGHKCKTPESLQKEEGKTIVDGVKIDPLGRPIGYYFLDGDTYRLEDATNVIHIFEPGRPNQYRGYPRSTAALNTLHDLEDLRILEMRANKDAAELSTIIKTASGEMPTQLASMAQRFRETSSASGTASSVSESRREFYQNAVGGRTIVLQNGDDAQQHVPQRPGQETRAYWRLLAEDVCNAGGIPLSVVCPDVGQGTIYRGSLDAFAAFTRGVTAVYASYFRRIRNYVLANAMAYNPKLAKKPSDWQKTTAGTVRAPNVDIGRNSQAMLAEVAAGTRTFNSVASELGLDGNELLRQKADEAAYIRELAKSRGIDPSEISVITIDKPARQTDLTPDQEEI